MSYKEPNYEAHRLGSK